MLPDALRVEETLDPANWDELRALGHRMLDDMVDHLQALREQPVWQPLPDDVRATFQAPIPIEGQPAEAVYDEFRHTVLPFTMGNSHPRFWGWVMGPGTPLAMLAEMLAAGMNAQLGGGDHAGPLVEAQVIDWLKEMLGFPAQASGLLVSGG